MSDSLPRVGGLSEPDKYDRLVERVPGVWWSDAGPFVGLHQLNLLRVDYFRAAFGGFGGKRALDVGCGGGILSEALVREGAIVTGVDPSEKSLASGGLGAGFDLVLAVDVLEHVDDLDSTLDAISTVLAPGGALGFLTHNRTLAAFLELIWDEEYVRHSMPEGFHEFARFITPAELADGLARHAMVVQEVKGVTRAPDGSRSLVDDTTITYIGWALRTR